MRILWDETKRLANLDKHKLDFVSLNPEFFLTALVVPARRPRFRAIGPFGHRTLSVVFVRYGTEAVSVISMRYANAKERRLLP